MSTARARIVFTKQLNMAGKGTYDGIEIGAFCGLFILIILICCVYHKCSKVVAVKKKGYDFVKNTDSEFTTDTDLDNMEEINIQD